MRTLCAAASSGDAGRVRVLLAGVALSERDAHVGGLATQTKGIGSPEGTRARARERDGARARLGGPDGI
jgi:hypothetical protein